MLADILALVTAKVAPRPKKNERSVRQARHVCSKFCRYKGLDGGYHGWRGYRCWECLKTFFTHGELPLFTMNEEYDLIPVEETNA